MNTPPAEESSDEPAVPTFSVNWRWFVAVLLYGALISTAYSLGYWGDDPVAYFTGLVTGAEEIGRLERSSTAWRPFIWPVKAIMVLGFFLMLLQAVSELFKDIARLRGIEIGAKA